MADTMKKKKKNNEDIVQFEWIGFDKKSAAKLEEQFKQRIARDLNKKRSK